MTALTRGSLDCCVVPSTPGDRWMCPSACERDQAACRAHPTDFADLEHDVVATVVRYPVPLLQKIGMSGVISMTRIAIADRSLQLHLVVC